MRRVAIAAVFATSTVALAMACASFTSNDAATADGGEGGGQDGSGSDAADASACTPILVDDFSSADASADAWAFLGDAHVDESVKEAQLVSDDTGQVGGMWHMLSAPMTDGTLHVHFFADIGPGPTGADGLTFSWLSNGTAQLGRGGDQLALCSMNNQGAAFVIDSYTNQLRLLVVADTCTVVDGGISDAGVFGTSEVDLYVAGTSVTGTFAKVPFAFTLPNAVGFVTIGFTAATGGTKARHALREVKIDRCP